jgi:ABC-type branched-subunit amino acid transport system permease subunit
MRYKRFIRVAMTLGAAALALSGCLLTAYLPTASCENVKYERKGEMVDVEAKKCRV